MPSVDLLYVDGSGHAGLASGSGTTEPIYPVIPEPTSVLAPLEKKRMWSRQYCRLRISFLPLASWSYVVQANWLDLALVNWLCYRRYEHFWMWWWGWLVCFVYVALKPYFMRSGCQITWKRCLQISKPTYLGHRRSVRKSLPTGNNRSGTHRIGQNAGRKSFSMSRAQ